jgi:hypothetical protein
MRNIFLFFQIGTFTFSKHWNILLLLLLSLGVISCQEEEIRPKHIFLTDIVLRSFPETTPAGEAWDDDSPPDVSILIQYYKPDGALVELVRTDTIMDAVHDSTYVFVFSPPIEVPIMDDRFELYAQDIDDDFSGDDEMYFFYLNLYNPNRNYDPDKELTDSWIRKTDGFDFTFNISYEY